VNADKISSLVQQKFLEEIPEIIQVLLVLKAKSLIKASRIPSISCLLKTVNCASVNPLGKVKIGSEK
jgi:hypothetical protein